jgi:hypothetical protein
MKVDAFCTADEVNTLRTLVRACLFLVRARRLPTTNGGRDSVASTPGPEPEAPEISSEPNPEPGEVEDGEVAEPGLADEIKGQEMCDRSVWLILCAVAGLWGQHDLWYDAEEVFSKI